MAKGEDGGKCGMLTSLRRRPVPAGRNSSGGEERRRWRRVKNYTSISCHSFLPSPPPPVAEHAKQLAQDAQQGADQIKVVEHGGSPMMRNWTASSGQGGGGYMTGFAARAVPETGPLMTTPARSLAPGLLGS